MDYSFDSYTNKYLVISENTLAKDSTYYSPALPLMDLQNDTLTSIILTRNDNQLPDVSITPFEWKNQIISGRENSLSSQVVTQFPISQAIIQWRQTEGPENVKFYAPITQSSTSIYTDYMNTCGATFSFTLTVTDGFLGTNEGFISSVIMEPPMGGQV